MRHAKSDWDSGVNSDFERPLNPRGREDAVFMGKYMFTNGLIPDIIISSPASRAKETTLLVAECISYDKDIIFRDELYFGSISRIIEILQQLDNSTSTVLLTGHNPTWESMCELLQDKKIQVIMSTASIASISTYNNSWSELKIYRNRLDWLISPKTIRKNI